MRFLLHQAPPLPFHISLEVSVKYDILVSEGDKHMVEL